MIIAVLLISFALEGIISNLIQPSFLFIPLFTIVSLSIVYPYFKDYKNQFYIYAIALGLLYDLVYTNIPFFNIFTFLITSFMIGLIYEYITVNKFNLSIISIVIILFYQIIAYILLCLVKYISFNEMTLLTNLYSSLILNVLYAYILYFIVYKLNKKYHIKKYFKG